MENDFQKKSSSIFVTAFIGVIIASFMFGGYDSLKGAPDTVAKVGGMPIKYREYQNEYNRQLQFYSRLFGGKSLTSKQIESFNIKDNALRNLINQKLLLSFAQETGIEPSSEEVKAVIKEQPYFKTNEQFDLQLYKNLLARNQWTPTEYEENIGYDIQLEEAQRILAKFPISDKYHQDIQRFKSAKLKLSIVQFSKSSMKNFIDVSSKDIEDYLKNAENLARVKSVFESEKSELSKKERVKGRHILLTSDEKNDAEIKNKIEELAKKVNPSNFAELADKNTEDPSGKGKGGMLDWFGRGQMVPEFEKIAFSLKPGMVSAPVKTNFGYHLILVEAKEEAKEATFDEHKNAVAKKLIQKQKNADGDKLASDLAVKIKDLLANDKSKELDNLYNTYKFKYEKDIQANRLDGITGNIMLDAAKTNQIFQEAKTAPKAFNFDTADTFTLVQAAPFKDEPKKEVKDNKKDKKDNAPEANEEPNDKQSLSTVLSGKLRQDLLANLEEKSKVKIYNKPGM